MNSVKKSVLLLSIFAFSNSYSQNDADTLLAKDNIMVPLPTLSVNFGFNHLMSDVALRSEGPSPFRQFGYQLSITQRATKFLNVTLDLYTGTVYGEEQRNLTNLNFRTTLFSQHLNIEYNFYPLIRPNANGRQLIRPYVGFGVGAIFFRSKGDLLDGNGNSYHYWSDGLIYAEVEGSVAQSEATSITRDFEYETDLRDANLDGMRKYSQTAFTLPLNAGIRFQITKNIGVNAAFAYAFNFSDMLDNISTNGVGNRAGSSGNDNHLFGSVGLSVFLGMTKPSSKPAPTFIEALVSEESSIDEKDSSSDKSEKELITNKNDLASISRRLVRTSESLVDIAEASDLFITQKTEDLSQLAKRNLETKKEIREVKKESIALIDSSMAALQKTHSGLKDASNSLNSAYTDFTDKKVDTRPSTTNKVKNTVEAKIPAMESLKSQIESAKSSAELKSILNVTSKNLTHTNEIFKSESSRMSESILNSRKTVVEARVQQLEASFQNASLAEEADLLTEIDSPSTITEELEKLFEEGILSEAEYHQLKSSVHEIEESVTLTQQANSGNIDASAKNKLASTTELLQNASETIAQKTEAARQLLSNYNQQLSALTAQPLVSKSDLSEVKKEALDLVEQANVALVTTNKELNSVADDLDQVSEKLEKNDGPLPRMEGTNKLKTTMEAVIPRLDDSKSKIRSAKTAEDLNQILAATSNDLTGTSEIFSTEGDQLAHATLKTRKYVVQNRIELLSLESSIDSEEFNSISVEIESLKKEKILSELELNEISAAILALKNSIDEDRSILGSTDYSETTDQTVEDKQSQIISDTNLDSTEPTSDEIVSDENKLEGKTRTVEEIENTPPKLSGGFHWADVNENGWISPDEVLHFIDLLFDGESVRTVEDIQNLIDYYFDQE